MNLLNFLSISDSSNFYIKSLQQQKFVFNIEWGKKKVVEQI